MVNSGRTGRRIIAWIAWGLGAALAYGVALPLLAGGLVLMPIAIVAFEDGALESAIAVAAGTLALVLLSGGLNLPALALMLAGIPLGALLRLGRSAAQTTVLPLVLALIGLLGLAYLPAQYGGVLTAMPAAETKLLQELLAANGLKGTFQQLIAQLIPAFVPVYAGVITLEAYFMTRWALRLRSKQLPDVLPFWLWVAPTWLPPLYLIAVAAQLATGLLGVGVDIGNAAWFVSIWTGAPLLFIGLAVVDHWLVRARLPQPARGIILTLAVILPLFSQLLTWLGVLDGVFDIRRFRQQQG